MSRSTARLGNPRRRRLVCVDSEEPAKAAVPAKGPVHASVPMVSDPATVKAKPKARAVEQVPDEPEAAPPVKKKATAIMQMPDVDPARGDIKPDGPGGMRIYSAILGREPRLDPAAPDVLDGEDDHESGTLGFMRCEMGRALHMSTPSPTWRDIALQVTRVASQKLFLKRKRFAATFRDHNPNDRAA